MVFIYLKASYYSDYFNMISNMTAFERFPVWRWFVQLEQLEMEKQKMDHNIRVLKNSVSLQILILENILRKVAARNEMIQNKALYEGNKRLINRGVELLKTRINELEEQAGLLERIEQGGKTNKWTFLKIINGQDGNGATIRLRDRQQYKYVHEKLKSTEDLSVEQIAEVCKKDTNGPLLVIAAYASLPP